MHAGTFLGLPRSSSERSKPIHPLDPKDHTMLKLITKAQARLNSIRDEETGATATEYALIIGVASILIVAALGNDCPRDHVVRPDRHRLAPLVRAPPIGG